MATYTAAAVGGNWNSAATWGGAGVPTTNDIVLFNQTSGNVTVTSGARCSEINFNSGTGYTGTITFTNTLIIDANTAFTTSGNITLTNAVGFTMVGPNGILWTSSGSLSRVFTSNGKAFNLPLNTGGSGSNTITLIGDFTVSNLQVAIGVLNGSNLIINGNVTGSSSIGSGSSSCVLAGATTTWNTLSVLNRVIFNSSGTITILGTVTCYNSITWTSGTLITTGSTMTMVTMSSISLAGNTLNNMSFTSNVTTTTVTGDFNLTGNLALGGGGGAFNGTGKVFVSGNVIGGGNSGTFTIEMNGTSSTISGTVYHSVIVNTSGTITVGVGCDIGGNSNLTLAVGTLNLANNLVKRGGTTTIAIGFLFTGSGNLVFSNNNFANTIHTVISNGVSFPNSVSINPLQSVTNTLVLNDNFTILGNYSSLMGASGGQNHTINGSNLLVRGNFTVTTTGGITGTSTIVLEGPSSTNLTTSGQIQNNLTVNKSGGATVTVGSSFTWGLANRTLTMNSPVNFLTNSTTLTLSGTPLTINNSSGSQFFNMTVPTGVTLNIN